MDYNHVADRIGEVIDGAGVAVPVAGAVMAAGAAAVRLGRHQAGAYRLFRQQFGRTILLGLELLVAGDIVRTVATEPTLTSVGILADTHLPELLAASRADRSLAIAEQTPPCSRRSNQAAPAPGAAPTPAGRVRGQQLTASDRMMTPAPSP